MTSTPSETLDDRTPATTMSVLDRVLWVHLQRPDVLNSINTAMVEGLHRALDRAERPDVRAVVIRGTGRAFCAGADLEQVPGAEIDVELLSRTVDSIATVVDRIAEFPKPVIAGVNGVTAAGGLELVLACDLVVAARGAQIADGHSNFGLLPGGGGSYRLPRRAGLSMAKRMMLTGDFVPVEELTGCGLISQVVDPDELDVALTRLSASLARRSPRVMAAMKQLADASLDRSQAQGAAQESATLRAYLQTPDLIEGLTAFRESRTPVFED